MPLEDLILPEPVRALLLGLTTRGPFYIALTGPAGCGKTSCADVLCEGYSTDSIFRVSSGCPTAGTLERDLAAFCGCPARRRLLVIDDADRVPTHVLASTAGIILARRSGMSLVVTCTCGSHIPARLLARTFHIRLPALCDADLQEIARRSALDRGVRLSAAAARIAVGTSHGCSHVLTRNARKLTLSGRRVTSATASSLLASLCAEKLDTAVEALRVRRDPLKVAQALISIHDDGASVPDVIEALSERACLPHSAIVATLPALIAARAQPSPDLPTCALAALATEMVDLAQSGSSSEDVLAKGGVAS